jgi:predicted dehydrogenase
MSSSIRIGIVGAGENTRLRHLPGLRAISGVEIRGVVNRTPESSARVSHDWQIPRVYSHWSELIDDPGIDAVVIGTWPHLHCEVTCAALAAGKHVLCEARMARDLAEARQMHAAHLANPGRVAMLVPSPTGLVCDAAVRDLVTDGFLGELREFVVLGGTDQFYDYSQPLHWRQDATLSGINTLALGILHETWLRWFPQPQRVIAQTQIFERHRPSPTEAGLAEVTVPDSVQVLSQMANGARGVYHLSGVQLFGPGFQIHLYGSSGTIKITFGEDDDQVQIGRAGDKHLQAYPIPDVFRGRWRVEEEFVAAIRGEEPVRLTNFAAGVRYMEFTAAVLQSAQQNQVVELM